MDNEEYESSDAAAAGGQPPLQPRPAAEVQWDRVSRTMAGVRGRWALPLLSHIAGGTSRPAALLDAVRSGETAGHRSLSGKVMYETLQRPCDEGLCTRQRITGWQPETHYQLTAKGREILAAISRLGAPSPPAGPAQLPAAIADFTGRRARVDQLRSLLRADEGRGAVPAVVISGPGGIGKTALAVHAAHEVRDEYPDGQLYVDLLGAGPRPVSPGEVLARFLRDLDIEGGRVPADDGERAALYRTTLAGRRVLVLLDNARDAAQVRPLLPGSSSCSVLVTTRSRASDLAGATFIDLDVLEDAEARQLFCRVAGEERASAEPGPTSEVLAFCAGLPLAIRICAARLAARGSWHVATPRGAAARRAPPTGRAHDRRAGRPGQLPGELRRAAVSRRPRRGRARVPAAGPVAGGAD